MLRKPRELRSPREIEAMRQAGLLVWQAHQRAASLMRPGVRTAEIEAVVAEFFDAHGAKPLFKNYPHPAPGGPPFPAVTCISVNEEVVHGIPGPRVLKEGDLVSLDTGCKLKGWCGDAAATYVIHPTDQDRQRLVDVTRQVLALAIELMGRKSRWSQVAAEMERFVKDHGFAVVEQFVGHGIGRQMHEDPQVPNFVGHALGQWDFRLEPGLVIAIEPMVNMGTKAVRCGRDRWTQVTADGLPSAHFEHTVALTDSGPVILTSGPQGETW